MFLIDLTVLNFFQVTELDMCFGMLISVISLLCYQIDVRCVLMCSAMLCTLYSCMRVCQLSLIWSLHSVCNYRREGIRSSWCTLFGVWSDNCIDRTSDGFSSGSSLCGTCVCNLPAESIQTLAAAGSLHVWTLWRLLSVIFLLNSVVIFTAAWGLTEMKYHIFAQIGYCHRTQPLYDHLRLGKGKGFPYLFKFLRY